MRNNSRWIRATSFDNKKFMESLSSEFSHIADFDRTFPYIAKNNFSNTEISFAFSELEENYDGVCCNILVSTEDHMALLISNAIPAIQEFENTVKLSLEEPCKFIFRHHNKWTPEEIYQLKEISGLSLAQDGDEVIGFTNEKSQTLSVINKLIEYSRQYYNNFGEILTTFELEVENV